MLERELDKINLNVHRFLFMAFINVLDVKSKLSKDLHFDAPFFSLLHDMLPITDKKKKFINNLYMHNNYYTLKEIKQFIFKIV